MPEQVNHPEHYNRTQFEVWDVLDAFFGTNPDKWNAGKYLLRAGAKGDEITDLEKARAYIDRRIAKLRAAAHEAAQISLDLSGKQVPPILEPLKPEPMSEAEAKAYPANMPIGSMGDAMISPHKQPIPVAAIGNPPPNPAPKPAGPVSELLLNMRKYGLTND